MVPVSGDVLTFSVGIDSESGWRIRIFLVENCRVLLIGSHSRNSVFVCIRDSMEITFHVSNFGDFLNNSLSNYIGELASLCRGTTPLTYTTCYWCGSREDTIPR